MTTDFCPAGDGYLDADDFRVYGRIADGAPVDVNDPHVRKLVDLGYVTFDPEKPGTPVLLNPNEVARRRVSALLEEAQKRVADLQSIPVVSEQLSALYERGQWRAGGGSEYIDDAAVVNARLDDVVGGAEWEILSAQPFGPRNDAQLNRSVERDTAALDRGVSKRTLYRWTVRDNAVTAEYARAMSSRMRGKSAEFRTMMAPFERAIIIDRRVAFISNHLVEQAPPHSAWQITDRAMVAYIVAEFEAKWRMADPWHGELRGRGLVVDTVSGGGGVRTSRRQREIMRDMVDGHSQRVTAGRLGISVRTVSDEINALKELFDAASREQLVFKWAWSADRMVDDSAPEAGGPAGAAEAKAGGVAA